MSEHKPGSIQWAVQHQGKRIRRAAWLPGAWILVPDHASDMPLEDPDEEPAMITPVDVTATDWQLAEEK